MVVSHCPDSCSGSLRRARLARARLTLLRALVAALFCVWLDTPIPWMIGPLLATSLASVLGAPTLSLNPLRNAGQWVIGTALGLYFTPAVGALVVGLWWAIHRGQFDALEQEGERILRDD